MMRHTLDPTYTLDDAVRDAERTMALLTRLDAHEELEEATSGHLRACALVVAALIVVLAVLVPVVMAKEGML